MGTVYVLTNPVMPGLVKIGRTEAGDASDRIAQLYSSGVPVPFTIEFAANVDDATKVEDALHHAFAPHRINPRREFFRIEPDQAIAILKLLHIQDATSEVQGELSGIDEQSLAAAEQQRSRRPNLDFTVMGIQVGSELRSARNDTTVVVASARSVRLGEEQMSLSAATRRMLGIEYPVAPCPFWTYEGRLLSDIYEETYGE